MFVNESSSGDEKAPGTTNGKVQVTANSDVELGQNMDRSLQARHLQFIAIGGTIGTGLFLGLGSALATAGPVSLLIAFIFMGSVVYSIMVSLGEMAAYVPLDGNFTAYATRFIDPTMGFAMGWIYWFSWAITFALELVAAGLIIQYWNASLSVGIWIAVFLVIFTALNFLPVRLFGEVEMWFSMIKVVTIVGFIIFAICINAGVGDEGYLGFKYWKSPGPFHEHLTSGGAGKFVGFWAVMVKAGFSYMGTELVAIGAGETVNPRKTIPEAVRWTFWGIFGLFVATVFFVGIDVPYTAKELGSTAENASASPLVLVATRAGVPVLPDIINAVLLTAVLSAANSNIYSSSRIMVALADEGHAPAFTKKTNRIGTPYYAVAACSILGLFGFLNLSSSGTVVFNWLLNISATASFVTWALISICHIRFQKALKLHGIERKTLPYIAPLQPYLSYYGFFFNSLILITNGFTVFFKWSTSDFFSCYISLILFVALWIGHKIVCRTKVIPVADIAIPKGPVDF